jgi:hypothetical protein
MEITSSIVLGELRSQLANPLLDLRLTVEHFLNIIVHRMGHGLLYRVFSETYRQ